MRIAVNTRFLLPDYLEGYGNFLFETLKRITAAHPEHDFLFIFDRPYEERFVFSKNVKAIVAGPPARHPILWKYWYDFKIPAILKKYKADVFLSCDGFCSLRTKLPQCLVVHDLAFFHFPKANKKSHLFFYKKYTPAFLQTAKSVATVSYFSKNDMIQKYAIPESKIDVVYSGVKTIFQPLTSSEKQEIKEKYTAGKEYFIYTGAIHPRKNLMNLLKAFSIFKKRQQTGMKLVLAGRLAWNYDSFVKSLDNYKYRNDVLLTGYIPDLELAKLVGGAYGLVYPSLLEGFGVPVLEAMQCHVPVITSRNSSMEEIAGNAAMYVDADNFTDIADKMMLLYKDETLRQVLIEHGKKAVLNYSWDLTADLLWESLLKAMK